MRLHHVVLRHWSNSTFTYAVYTKVGNCWCYMINIWSLQVWAPLFGKQKLPPLLPKYPLILNFFFFFPMPCAILRPSAFVCFKKWIQTNVDPCFVVSYIAFCNCTPPANPLLWLKWDLKKYTPISSTHTPQMCSLPSSQMCSLPSCIVIGFKFTEQTNLLLQS